LGIIDIHAHAFPEPIARKAVEHIGTHYGIKMAGKGLLSDLRDSAERFGVDYVVFHSTATKPTQVTSVNDWIIKNSGGMMIGFGTIHPDFEDPESEIDRLIRAGLKGIKLHPDFQGFDADSPKMDRIYRCIGSRIPVLMHAGDEKLDHASPERISNVIERFPELRLIAAHLGGHQKWKEAEQFLFGKNLWLDTSSAIAFMEPQQAVEIIRKHGVERVVFGTDYPITYHDRELAIFNQLNLNQQEKEAILWQNAARLLNL
jgi:predicted TIM-barrel fold metal-dependent hydrolase